MLDGVGWCARQALPVTTSAICKEARSGRALKVLFSCQNKRQLCLLFYPWVSQLGDPDINRPKGRRSYLVLPTREIRKQSSFVLLVNGIFSPSWAPPDSIPRIVLLEDPSLLSPPPLA